MLLRSATGLRLTTLTNIDELEALAPEWTELSRRLPSTTPFQTPAWLIPFCAVFAGGQTRTLVLREAHGRLVGVVPFYLWKSRGVRHLLLLGSGVSDYLDAVLEPWHARDALRLLGAHLADDPGWDVCELQQLRADSFLLHFVPPPEWTDERVPHESCPVLSLRAPAGRLDWKGPPGLLKRVDAQERRAAKEGALEFYPATEENFPGLFESLAAFHRARWPDSGERGGELGPDPWTFHRAAAERLLGAGMLRLYALSLNGRVMAVSYGMQQHGRAYYYLPAFDAHFGPLSPGKLLLARVIRQARAEGAVEFHFLRGQEAYKFQWGAQNRPTVFRRLRRRSPPTPWANPILEP